MGDIRARDADRERVVEVIEDAYVDGQLGAEDRDLRVAQALTAASLDELAALTRDLQVVPVAAEPPPAVPARPADERRRRSGAGVGAAAAAVLLLGLAAFVLPADTDSATSGDVVVESEPVVRGEPTASPVEERGGLEMTPAGLRELLRSYEAEFGTLDAYEAVVHPTGDGTAARASVEVPVRGSRPRAQRWSYDGTWRRGSEASAVIRPGAGIVDLGALDVRRLFANIPRAERTLGVQRGELTHVSVRRNTAGVPTVNIYVGNRFNESAYLMTTMSGETLRSFPWSP